AAPGEVRLVARDDRVDAPVEAVLDGEVNAQLRRLGSTIPRGRRLDDLERHRRDAPKSARTRIAGGGRERIGEGGRIVVDARDVEPAQWAARDLDRDAVLYASAPRSIDRDADVVGRHVHLDPRSGGAPDQNERGAEQQSR